MKLPTKVKVPRSIRLSKESLNLVDIHVFGDASLLGTCAVAYSHTASIWNQTRVNCK